MQKPTKICFRQQSSHILCGSGQQEISKCKVMYAFWLTRQSKSVHVIYKVDKAQNRYCRDFSPFCVIVGFNFYRITGYQGSIRIITVIWQLLAVVGGCTRFHFNRNFKLLSLTILTQALQNDPLIFLHVAKFKSTTNVNAYRQLSTPREGQIRNDRLGAMRRTANVRSRTKTTRFVFVLRSK